jgi:multiple sugar transport system permease protein
MSTPHYSVPASKGAAKVKRLSSVKKTNRMLMAVNFILLSLFSLTVLLPMWFMFITAVKTSQEVYAYPPTWWPTEFVWSNFGEAWQAAPFSGYLGNSVIVAAFAVVGSVLSNSLVAYGFAKMRFVGRNFWFAVILATMMIPGFVTMIPQYILYANIGWVGTFLPLIVPPFLGSAFFIFMLRQFYMTIPTELIESAYIDGANNFYIWRKLIVPMSAPALTTVGVLAFNGSWNDFLGPLLYLTDPATFTLPIGLKVFIGQLNTQWNFLLAASCMVLLPIIIVFLLFQRYFLEGMNLNGALKG